MVKNAILVFTWLFTANGLSGQMQALTLDKANQLARENYPLLKQKDLVMRTADLSIDNLRKGFLPQVLLSAQATYQSEVTEIKIPVPGVSVTPLSRDQYKMVAEVNQLIYDGGVINEQKQLHQLSADVEQQNVEVDLYRLKERINQVYLSILYLDEQLEQVDLVKNDLLNGINKTEAQVIHGVAFRSSLNMLKAELLKTEQRAIDIKAARKGLLETLGLFMNQTLPENLQLEKPVVNNILNETGLERPEIKLFSSREKLLDRQEKLIDAKNLPRASLFAQGGYGKPGLNFLKNEFDYYYLAGVKLSWSLANFYTRKNDKQLLEVNKKMVDTEKQTFLLNTGTQLKQQQYEIIRLQELVDSDQEIIRLRTSVKDAAKAQLENGVIMPSDYLREVNAEDLARQTLITHQLQLLQAQINYKTISGK